MKFLNSIQMCPQTEVHLPVFVIVLIERVKIRVKRCSIHWCKFVYNAQNPSTKGWCPLRLGAS